MTLETITINLVGRAVLKVHEGREYLVAPGTSIVPGVLHGSEGPLFYPHKQIARNFKDWDNTAITIFHPTDNYNIPASAKDIAILKKHGIGILKNSTIGPLGQLQHDLWFDVEYTKNADKKHGTDIYGRLTRGEPIELSTGLYTKNEPRKGTYNGKPYQFVARNYRPDHLAILPNQTGACSLQDGCGVLINEATQLEPQAKSLLTRILEALRINAKTCPKCGMEMDGKECSECNYTENVFCDTGEGGGVDPSCGREDSEAAGGSKKIEHTKKGKTAIEASRAAKGSEDEEIQSKAASAHFEAANEYNDLAEKAADSGDLKNAVHYSVLETRHNYAGMDHESGEADEIEDIERPIKRSDYRDALESLQEGDGHPKIMKAITKILKRTKKPPATENALAPGVGRHAERGQFLPRGSGTGKGEQHTAAKVGFGRVCPTCGGALDDAGFCPTCPDDDEAEAEYKAQHALEEASLTDIDEPVLASLDAHSPALKDLDY